MGICFSSPSSQQQPQKASSAPSAPVLDAARPDKPSPAATASNDIAAPKQQQQTNTNSDNNSNNTNSSNNKNKNEISTSNNSDANAGPPKPAKPASFRHRAPPDSSSVILKNPYPDLVSKQIGDMYDIGKELGRGEFGVTCSCENKETKQILAVKSIPKKKLKTAIDIEDVRREVAILHHLPSHPNVVALRGVFEDEKAVHIVQDLCSGGELFERIVERGHYSERQAATIMRVIVKVLQVCHDNGVIHRDLKPENFLFSSKGEDADLRAIDFGLSTMFTKGQTFSEIVGSPYYMAPEVLRKHYWEAVDVWSAGVILYILLCGVPPFWAETEQGVAQAVLLGHINFERDPWPRISQDAKHLVVAMLQQDPSKRPKPQQLLDHPFLRDAESMSNSPLGDAVLSRMKRFSTMNKLKKRALQVIAENVSSDEVRGLKELFTLMDADNSGSITLDELRDGLRKTGSNLSDMEVKALLEAADLDGNGTIDYGEFLAATLHRQRIESEDNLKHAFEYFDTDGSGFIDTEELAEAIGGQDLETLHEILKEVDLNSDGRISYEEFCWMMKQGPELKTDQRHLSRDRSVLRNLFKLDLAEVASPHGGKAGKSKK